MINIWNDHTLHQAKQLAEVTKLAARTCFEQRLPYEWIILFISQWKLMLITSELDFKFNPKLKLNWIQIESWNQITWPTSLIQAGRRGSAEKQLDLGVWKVPQHRRGNHGTWKVACGQQDKWMNRLRRSVVSLTLPAISSCSWQAKAADRQHVNATIEVSQSIRVPSRASAVAR